MRIRRTVLFCFPFPSLFWSFCHKENKSCENRAKISCIIYPRKTKLAHIFLSTMGDPVQHYVVHIQRSRETKTLLLCQSITFIIYVYLFHAQTQRIILLLNSTQPSLCKKNLAAIMRLALLQVREMCVSGMDRLCRVIEMGKLVPHPLKSPRGFVKHVDG